MNCGTRRHFYERFEKGHPQYNTHVQRLRKKFSIIQFIGMQIPKNPGPVPDSASEFQRWERQMTKLCNFIEAVYLPWTDVRRGFRPYQEVLAELREFKFGDDGGEPTVKTSFINRHILRTIGFALNNKGVSSSTKKMIQLVRHQFSRKRGALSCYLDEDDRFDRAEEMEMLEVLRDNQLDVIGHSKPKTAIDLHIDELLTQYRSITSGVNFCGVSHAPKLNLNMSEVTAGALLSKLKEEAEESSEVQKVDFEGNGGKEESINKELFFEGINWTDGQKKAAEYMLDKLDKSKHNEQLLMMLHGPPGTGKTFLIKRLRDITNIEMRITATSGVAAMSLNGTTIDHFLAKGFRKKKKTKIETVRKNVGKATLLVLDEVSMMGSKKLLDLDKTLQKVNKTTAPFGGLDVIVVGDFAQLPAVKQTPLIESMVRSTLLHTPPTELTLKTTALMSMFVKFDLEEFKRSDTCTDLSSLLRRLRNSFSGRSTFTLKDVKRIGVLNNETFTRDKKFRDASFLVATRKEKDAVISFAGKKWAEDHCRPMYWWYARPVSFKGCSEDADVIAEGMHQKCFAAKE